MDLLEGEGSAPELVACSGHSVPVALGKALEGRQLGGWIEGPLMLWWTSGLEDVGQERFRLPGVWW